MKAAKFIRLLSLFGILMLLILQYIWFRNSYIVLEQDIRDKCKTSLIEAVEKDLFNRINGSKTKINIKKGSQSGPDETKDVKQQVNKSTDFDALLQQIAILEGHPCKIDQLDSIYRIHISEALGFVPQYSLRLITGNGKNIRSSKNTLYGKITETQYAELTLVNPLGSILRQAQMILIASVLLVVIIGIVLIYLLRSTLREAKFVTFIKEYTHALTHELKTPISGIYMASSQLASGIFEERPEARQKYYAMCKESSSKLLSTVDRILLVAKAEHSKITTNPSLVEVKPFIDKIVDTHRNNNFRRKDVTLSCNCDPEDLKASFDPFLMENVLNNLIDNAIKYSEQSVAIHIETGVTEKLLQIRVKDNGFGIAENELKHIFDSFERGNKVQGKGIDGFGIGLNYVNKVIRAHKGTIHVESEEGKGTEFTIQIPKG
jgi:two-component system phosphate regulon sensor histidine kinase PhoR